MGADNDELGVKLEWPGDDANRPAVVPPMTVASNTELDAASYGGEEPLVLGTTSVSAGRPLLPAMITQIEVINAALGLLATRVDALTSATSSLQAMFSDRLIDVAQSTNDVRELRQSVAEHSELTRRVVASVEESANDLLVVRELLDRMVAEPRASGGAAKAQVVLDPVVTEELTRLREEMTQLKRRVGVRGRTTVPLGDEQLAAIADAVVERLESMIEVVHDDPPASPPPSKSRSKTR